MNILKIIVVLFFYLLLINNFKSQDQSPITLIVNPNNNNNTYIIGEKCGIETFTCNSISDAVEFFRSFAVILGDGNIYQQLNIKLSNGTYGIKENSINLFQFNCTITPLENGGEIIFNGLINPLELNETLIDINSDGSINSNASASVLISGINFINFQKSIINTQTSDNQLTEVTIDQCSFNNYQCQSDNYMISFSTNSLVPLGGTFTISNSIISNISLGSVLESFNNGLINSNGINIELINLNILDVSFALGLIIIAENSNLNITDCNWININTLGGAINVADTNVTIENSTFDSLITNCVTEINYGEIFISSEIKLIDTPISFINNSVFHNNSKPYDSVISIFSSPISINDCSFYSDVNHCGRFFSIYESLLTVTNSTLIGLLDKVNWLLENQSINYSTLIFSNSSVLFDSCTFGNDYTSIGCSLSSNVTFINSINFNPFYSCENCNHLIVDSNSICDSKSVTTSTLINNDSSNSLKLIPNIHSIIAFILLITTATIIISSYIF
ncbi:hypothetical protein ACTFIR_009138 [Dictyostelium discoideum]